MAITYDFDADLATVAGMMADPDFLKARSAALGDLGCEVEVSGDDEAYTVQSSRTVVQDLPKVLAKMFDPKQTMNLTENWRWTGEGYEGDLAVEIIGQPVTVTGNFSLMPSGDGCHYEVSHKVKAKIPLVGKQVEKFIMGQFPVSVGQELDYLRDQL